MSAAARLLVFTDLDGTLLDHETYDYNAAKPALSALTKRGDVLILASSKTAAEIEPLRKELGIEHCEAIVENGAGILEPGSRAGAQGGEYRRLLHALDGLPTDLRSRFRGFSQMSVTEVADATGLEVPAAELARARRFSEPGRWSGTDAEFERFCLELGRFGISAQQGGRFVTLSFGMEKADRVEEIATRYRSGESMFVMVALGDAPNDAAMLEMADLGIVIANNSHAALPELEGEKRGTIRRSETGGPAGWNEEVLKIINDLENAVTADG